MEECNKCIYRNTKNFNICKRNCSLKSTNFCRYHMRTNFQKIYKIFYSIIGNNDKIIVNDIYNIYKYINDNVQYENDILYKEVFIETLKIIPYKYLLKITLQYVNNKKELYDLLYTINRNTYKISKSINLKIIINAQSKIQYKHYAKNDYLNNCINREELFTCDNVVDIPKKKLFILTINNVSYAFDVIELDYFVRRCIADNVHPYNPYTRDILCEKELKKIKMFIKYNKLSIKNNECIWETDMHCYTDLSIEIERRGFYNNPEWFNKMKTGDFLKTIKYFKDFSNDIEQSKLYFNNINADTLSIDFCKDGIKMFRECKDDLYILCCNFMKALALCSSDFYNNIPDWVLNVHTNSHIIHLPNNNINNINNFLLYYYVEYM